MFENAKWSPDDRYLKVFGTLLSRVSITDRWSIQLAERPSRRGSWCNSGPISLDLAETMVVAMVVVMQVKKQDR